MLEKEEKKKIRTAIPTASLLAFKSADALPATHAAARADPPSGLSPAVADATAAGAAAGAMPVLQLRIKASNGLTNVFRLLARDAAAPGTAIRAFCDGRQYSYGLYRHGPAGAVLAFCHGRHTRGQCGPRA